MTGGRNVCPSRTAKGGHLRQVRFTKNLMRLVCFSFFDSFHVVFGRFQEKVVKCDCSQALMPTTGSGVER